MILIIPLFSRANRFADYKNTIGSQNDDQTLYVNPVNGNPHHSFQGNVSFLKVNPCTARFRGNVRDLCIYSYNSRAFDSTKQDILKTLLSISGDSLPVICNQENFLLKANGFITEKCLPDHHIFFKPATKNVLTNGLFIVAPICLKKSV